METSTFCSPHEYIVHHTELHQLLPLAKVLLMQNHAARHVYIAKRALPAKQIVISYIEIL